MCKLLQMQCLGQLLEAMLRLYRTAMRVELSGYSIRSCPLLPAGSCRQPSAIFRKDLPEGCRQREWDLRRDSTSIMQCCCAEPEEPCSTACVTPQCNACVTKVVEAPPCGTEATYAWISVYVIEAVDMTRIAQNLLPNSVQKLCWLHLEEQQLYYLVYTRCTYTGPPMDTLAKPPVKQQYPELSFCAAERANELHPAASSGACHACSHMAIWVATSSTLQYC